MITCCSKLESYVKKHYANTSTDSRDSPIFGMLWLLLGYTFDYSPGFICKGNSSIQRLTRVCTKSAYLCILLIRLDSSLWGFVLCELGDVHNKGSQHKYIFSTIGLSKMLPAGNDGSKDSTFDNRTIKAIKATNERL